MHLFSSAFASSFSFTVISCLLFMKASFTNCITTEAKLRNQLLLGYDRWTRPVAYSNDVVNVTFAAAIYQIVDFDAKAETLTTLLWPLICWSDINIHWTPEDYENLDVIRLNQHEIWIPDIVPHNDVGSWNTEKYKNLIPLYAYHDGEICWVFPTIMETICTMDVINFPYDEQRCQVQLGSWQYSSSEVRTTCLHGYLDKTAFTPNSHWHLTNSTCEDREAAYIYDKDNKYSFIFINVDLQRMDQFYVQNLILPSGILLSLSSLIFFLPCEFSDRTGYGITVTLALCVNLVIVIDFIPETSRSIPSLCSYFLVCICLSGFSILLSTVSLNFASSRNTNETTETLDNHLNVTSDEIAQPVSNGNSKSLQPISNGLKSSSKIDKFFAEQLNIRVDDPMKLFDRTAGIVYLLATTFCTFYFLWR